MNALLRDLSVVAELKAFQKLSFHDGPYASVSKVGIVSSIRRLVFGDSRETTFCFLESLYTSAHEICTLLLESTRLNDRTEDGSGTVIHQLRTLHAYATKSLEGLTALRQTYAGDEAAMARLNVIALRADELANKVSRVTDVRPRPTTPDRRVEMTREGR